MDEWTNTFPQAGNINRSSSQTPFRSPFTFIFVSVFDENWKPFDYFFCSLHWALDRCHVNGDDSCFSFPIPPHIHPSLAASASFRNRRGPQHPSTASIQSIHSPNNSVWNELISAFVRTPLAFQHSSYSKS